MYRTIIQIDEEKCTGCGACATACHEGAIAMVNGKAKLLRDEYCDGLGSCLPACPTGAIRFETREARAYDPVAVEAKKSHKGCPGVQTASYPQTAQGQHGARLANWPVQLRLLPQNASFFNGARLLVAADCAAYACPDFHERFIKDHVTAIGCPKLDGLDYAEKLTAILRENNIKDVTLARMEVPCCGGLERALKTALRQCGKSLPLRVAVVSSQGEINDQKDLLC